jgi:hypothetical protein
MRRGKLFQQNKRAAVIMSLLMAALVLLVGCAPRATGGSLTATADEDQVVIDLPALVLDVQADGSLSLGGQSLAALGSQIGQDLSAVSIPAGTVDLLVVGNIQHIQVDNTPDGLLILVNGQPVPSLAWDGEKLVATAEVLDTLGAGVALLDKVLPLISNLGIGVIIRFPIAQGADALPLLAPTNELAEQSRAAQQAFLAGVGTPPTIQLTVQYAADGTWTVADLNQAEWASLIAPLEGQLNLPPDTLAQLSALGIAEMGFATNSDGIFISINGKTLPYISWADGRVSQLLVLAQQTGLLSQVLPPGQDPTTIIETVNQLLPAVQASNVSLRVRFP